jgi:hypothetical protein
MWLRDRRARGQLRRGRMWLRDRRARGQLRRGRMWLRDRRARGQLRRGRMWLRARRHRGRPLETSQRRLDERTIRSTLDIDRPPCTLTTSPGMDVPDGGDPVGGDRRTELGVMSE